MSLPNITKIDINNVPCHLPSLCIPRVICDVNESQIRKIFNDLGLGIIERIDLVTKYSHSGEKYNRVFIHFKKWFQESNAKKARERLLNGNEIKVMYEEPWFWKVSAYREPNLSQNRIHQNQDQIEYKPFIPSLVPPAPSASGDNENKLKNPNSNSNSNSNSKNLMPIDNKITPIQVKKILIQKKENL